MRRLAAILAAAAAVAVLVWWLFREAMPAGPAVPEPTQPGPSVPQASLPEPLAQSKPAERKITPAGFAEPAPGAELPASRPDLPAVIRGRCVDAAGGAPLAACNAALYGWAADAERVDAHVARYGPAVWKDPESVITGEDGRFEIRFVPPGPYQFMLTLTALARANMQGRWPHVPPGAVVDVGDVPMERGTAVRGRVLDAEGAPQPKVTVLLAFRDSRAAGQVGVQRATSARSGPDGTFVIAGCVPAGTFGLEARGACRLVEPATLEIREGEVDRFVEVKVRFDIEAEAISGVVRDDAGKPIEGARLDWSPHGSVSPNSRLVMSDREGAFRIQRVDQKLDEPVAITAACAGYEPSASPTQARWGSKDVVVVLRRGLTVQISVRDGDLDEPLERYGVRCISAPASGVPWNSQAARLRENGTHSEGILNLGGVERGRQLLIVEPEGPEWAPSAGREFEMTDSGAPRQEVTVWRNVRNKVRVKRPDGSPVAKTKIDLLRRFGNWPVDEHTRPGEQGQIDGVSAWGPLRVAQGETAENGTLELAGPKREPLVLRVLGPGHVPLVREVSFEAAGAVIDVTVGGGATLVGRIQPPDVVPKWSAPLPVRRGQTVNPDDLLRGVFLQKPGTVSRIPLSNRPAPLADDGGFRIEGIPAGAWEVFVQYAVPILDGSSWGPESIEIARVELVDGQERRETFDVSQLVKAEIEGAVTLDGKPLEVASVELEGTRPGPHGESLVPRAMMKVRPGGRFGTTLWPADYRLTAHFTKDGRPLSMADGQVFRVGPGQKLIKTFDLLSSLLKLRVVASDGVTPVSGVFVRFEAPKGSSVGSGKTGAHGMVDVEGLPAGEVSVSAWRKECLTNEGRIKFMRGGQHGIEDMWASVGSVTVTPPETSATIVLPASAGY